MNSISLTLLAGLMLMNLDLAAKPVEVHHEHLHAPAHLANPHLHGARPELERYRHWDRHLSHHWYGRWAYYGWVGLHRGLGTVEGKVIGAKGEPVEGFTVSLRGSNGAYLKPASRRHAQVTGLAGTFLMSHVRAGHYRVRAAKGSLNKHSGIFVRAGQVSTTVVRI